MTTFTPSNHLKDFTRFIINKCIDNNHYNFAIFPLFIQFLLPFNDPASCLKNLDFKVDTQSDFKNYNLYFKNLFHYYNLLDQKHKIQLKTLTHFDSLIALATSSSSAVSTEFVGGAITPEPATAPTRESFIQLIQANYTKINDLDLLISTAIQDFDNVKDWKCNDLHIFINSYNDTPVNNTTDNNNINNNDDNNTNNDNTNNDDNSNNNDDNTNATPPNLQAFIQKCIVSMNGAESVIDLKTVLDDTPDFLFKKFVTIICTNYNTPEHFNNAKFWVLSQLFYRL